MTTMRKRRIVPPPPLPLLPPHTAMPALPTASAQAVAAVVAARHNGLWQGAVAAAVVT